MTNENTTHIDTPSKHSTKQVDKFLNKVQANVDDIPGAGSPAIMPDTTPDDDGKPTTVIPKKPKN